MRGNGWRAVARLLFLVVCLGLGLGPSAVAAAPPTVTFPSQFNTTLRPDQGFKFVVRIQTDPGATIQSWAFLVNGVDVTRDFEAAIASGAVQTTIERDAEADVRTYTVPQISLSTGQYQVRLTVTSPGTAAGVGLWSVTVSPDARTLSPAQEAFLADHGKPDYLLITFETTPQRRVETWIYYTFSVVSTYTFHDGTQVRPFSTVGAPRLLKPAQLDPAAFRRNMTLTDLVQVHGAPASLPPSSTPSGAPKVYFFRDQGFSASFLDDTLHTIQAIDR